MNACIEMCPRAFHYFFMDELLIKQNYYRANSALRSSGLNNIVSTFFPYNLHYSTSVRTFFQEHKKLDVQLLPTFLTVKGRY